MNIWKEKLNSVVQKCNTASRNLLSNLRSGDVKRDETENEQVNNSDDQCSACQRRMKILVIDGDESGDRDIFERQKDREEIRRKLAMDSDNEDSLIDKKNGTKIERLKDSNNLQICFMNETAKEIDSPTEQEHSEQKLLPIMPKKNSFFTSNMPKCVANQNNNSSPKSSVIKRQRPNFFFNRPRSWHAPKVEVPQHEEDLFTHHRRLQTEAREALAQAKDMARMQMEIERQNKKKSPIAEIVGIPFSDGHNQLRRQALLEMNVAQLQVIVNDLHSQIETLNDDLVKFLLDRDDLHMEQDSMLVDIEDLTRYLGLKENSSINHHTGFMAAANYSNTATNNK